MLTILTVSLTLTLLLELGFARLWGLRERRELLLVLLANCLTNPPAVLLHYLSTHFWGFPSPVSAAVLECAAVLIEWRIFRAGSKALRHPFRFALLANALSFGAGCAINFLF